MPEHLSRVQRRIVAKVHGVAAKLKHFSRAELQNYVADLRESVHLRSCVPDLLAIPAIAASNEALRRVQGIELYDVQVLAANALMSRKVANMQTGEGKTLVAVPTAVYSGLFGRGTHVATPNAYLAERDCEQLKSVYEELGMTAGLLNSQDTSPHAKSKAYRCDITYGPGHEFGFDYLRDQVMLKEQRALPRGVRQIECLQGNRLQMPIQQRGLASAIVDEIDSVLIDDASSPQILSSFQSGEAQDSDAVQLANRLADNLEQDLHYREVRNGQFRLTRQGFNAIHDASITIPANQIARPWTQYVEAALCAKFHFVRDIDYVVVDDTIRIVEKSTGRIFEDRSWQAGLHQAIEAEEQVPITPESLPLAQVTRQRFYRLYSRLAGMTGTTENCIHELKKIYGLDVAVIPLRVPSQRRTLPIQAFSTSEERWEAIARAVSKIHRKGQPVLIGTRTIKDSCRLADKLLDRGLRFELLNGVQDADESKVISRAGHESAITIATNLAGRGTDIKLTPRSRSLGGLHVIVSECQASARVDRQLIGRCARQGDPGSFQTFVSAEDWLFANHVPWLSKSASNFSKIKGKTLNSFIRKLQSKIERTQFANRLQLLQANQLTKQLLSRTSG